MEIIELKKYYEIIINWMGSLEKWRLRNKSQFEKLDQWKLSYLQKRQEKQWGKDRNCVIFFFF